MQYLPAMAMRFLALTLTLALLPGLQAADYFSSRNAPKQLIVAVADDWSSTRAKLWRFEMVKGEWQAVSTQATPVLLGKKGLAWGRGALPNPEGTMKREGDWKTPAGYFAIGKVYGYPEHLPAGSSFPYHQVGYYDCWVDDASNPYYNQHYKAKPGKEPPWFEKQRMRLGDYAYTYRIEVRHNSDPPVPGYGSAIFFHYRRGPDRPTAGCTTMADSELKNVIQWLRADQNPHYVILPRAEYEQLRQAWQLPAIP